MNNNAVLPVIPETITVHLGRPEQAAQNVTLSFADYIANVASSEIYPTWPVEALKANIMAQISYTLNRVYTEFYRVRGYDFDITNSTSVDQAFVNGREIFDNINDLVGELFTSYVRRGNNVEPLFTAYCDGNRTTCPGLSQWGTVRLAERGYDYIAILKNYYGNDINIVTGVPIAGVSESAPPFPLRVGSVGDDVRTVQLRLNRISANYPNIPKIYPVDGIFIEDTETAVKIFQKTFGLTQDGIVGRATWYKIQQVYAGVKRLNEITSEGIALEEVTKQYPELLRIGDSGIGVASLQYYIAYLSQFYNTIPSVAVDGNFGSETESAVKDLQSTFGLVVDGVVGPVTWNVLYDNYLGTVESIPLEYVEGLTVPFPGVIIRIGSESDEVRLLQEYLIFISKYYEEIPKTNATGYFGAKTQAAVLAFQSKFGLTPTGTVGPITWKAITDIYSDLYRGERLSDGQYPGFPIGG